MSKGNGVLQLFDEIADHDPDDLWLSDLEKSTKQSLHIANYQQKSVSGTREVTAPSCSFTVENANSDNVDSNKLYINPNGSTFPSTSYANFEKSNLRIEQESVSNQQYLNDSLMAIQTQLPGCVQMVNGQLVVQAQLQQVDTPNGPMTVAVLPSINGLQLSNSIMTNIPNQSTFNDKITTNQTAEETKQKSKRPPRSIMPRPNGLSRPRPRSSAVLMPPTPLVPNRTPTPYPPLIPANSNVLRLSTENASIVAKLSAEIVRLQNDNKTLANSDQLECNETVIRQLEEQRTQIFTEALRMQHGCVAPEWKRPNASRCCSQKWKFRENAHQLANQCSADVHLQDIIHHFSVQPTQIVAPSPSSQTVHNPEVVFVQSNQKIVSINGQSYLMVNTSRNFPENGTIDTQVLHDNSASNQIFNGNIARLKSEKHKSQIQLTRTKRIRDYFSKIGNVQNNDTERPFENISDAIQRLLPYHVYEEPELKREILDEFDDHYRHFSTHLIKNKMILENRFRAVLFKEAMKSSTEKAEISLLLYLQSRYEQECLDIDKEKAAENLVKFVSESEICALKGGKFRIEEENRKKQELMLAVESVAQNDEINEDSKSVQNGEKMIRNVGIDIGDNQEFDEMSPLIPKKEHIASRNVNLEMTQIDLQDGISKNPTKKRKKHKRRHKEEKKKKLNNRLRLKLCRKIPSANMKSDEIPKVPKLTIRLTRNSVENNIILQCCSIGSAPENVDMETGLEPSDSESDSIHAISLIDAHRQRMRFSSHFHEPSRSDIESRMRTELIANLDVDSASVSKTVPFGGLEMSDSE